MFVWAVVNDSTNAPLIISSSGGATSVKFKFELLG